MRGLMFCKAQKFSGETIGILAVRIYGDQSGKFFDQAAFISIFVQGSSNFLSILPSRVEWLSTEIADHS